MITARIDRKNHEIVVQGHAGAEKNQEGHDLVCCAVSTLVQAFIVNTHRANYRITWEINPGYTRIDLGHRWMDNYMGAMVDMLEGGLTMLQQAYPACISVKT